jgi:hypothetical protein
VIAQGAGQGEKISTSARSSLKIAFKPGREIIELQATRDYIYNDVINRRIFRNGQSIPASCNEQFDKQPASTFVPVNEAMVRDATVK